MLNLVETLFKIANADVNNTYFNDTEVNEISTICIKLNNRESLTKSESKLVIDSILKFV